MIRSVSRLQGVALTLMSALILGACGQSGSDNSAVVPAPGPELTQEELRAELLTHDEKFAAVAESEGVAEAYRRFMAADALQLPDGGLAIRGRDNIYEELLALTEGMEFSLSWEPADARVAESGELGFTWGIYYFEAVDELGAPYIAEGKYVYVWERRNDRWELILDITNQTEPDYEAYEEWIDDEYEDEEYEEEPGQDIDLAEPVVETP